MIVRTYGRRRPTAAAANGYPNDAVSGDPYAFDSSQESEINNINNHKLYNLTFSQDSDSQPDNPWSQSSDPYGLDSSSQELTILPPPRKKKNKKGGNQKSIDHFAIDSDPYSFDSSQELCELAILPPESCPLAILPPPKKRNKNGSDSQRSISSDSSQEIAILPHEPRHLTNLAPPKKKSGNQRAKKPSVEAAERAERIETATLMETQEYGEMMEHVDEVNFALDGLKKGQPVRIRRASLLSLLNICATVQQRRLLRTHGTVKTIIGAVLGINFDDTPSNLAAAALFYILTSDGQESHLLESAGSIDFLLKLLKPLTSEITKDTKTTLGSKLLALSKDGAIYGNKGIHSCSVAILRKVQEILVGCKDMKAVDGNNDSLEKPELTPKCIALLTMEKACLSTISLEETTGTVRKSGGNFKEKFRQHGGLDAVFDIVGDCHTSMEGWLEQCSSSTPELSKSMSLENLVVLLKCLKIMENATFLSNDNQSHLLGMEGNFGSYRTPVSFTGLILSVIKILSGVSLHLSSSGSSDETCCNISNGTSQTSEPPLILDETVNGKEIISISSSVDYCSMDWISSQNSSNASQRRGKSSDNHSGFSQPSSQSSSTSLLNMRMSKMGANSSACASCNGASTSTDYGAHVGANGLLGKHDHVTKPVVTEGNKFEHVEDSQDPFAFDEDEFEPSKWDLLSGKQNASPAKKGKTAIGEAEGGSPSLAELSLRELHDGGDHNSSLASCSAAVDEDKSNLLTDCLLAAVKVMMNLTNDNPVGCQQIAACGGLECLSSLIAHHFPLFNSHLPTFSELRGKSVFEVDHQKDRHLTDQELDFLVAILGLLVNLVEKDGRNRSRLATTSVPLRGSEGLDDESRDVIPLLCAIFMANQGAGETAEEGRHSSKGVDEQDEDDPISQGEKEAEKMIVEAYSALLLAFLSTESKSIRNAIAEYLPKRSLSILVPVLERFLDFHLSLDMISPETHTTVLEVIESCRIP